MAKRKRVKVPTKSKATKAESKSKRPDGSISSGIYDQVEKLVAGGKMTRAAAFRHHAEATGRKEGTVAVSYYYAAKKRGAKQLKRGRRKIVAAFGGNGASSRVESALKLLADMIRAQEAELARLRVVIVTQAAELETLQQEHTPR